jgi:hypothetical protein
MFDRELQRQMFLELKSQQQLNLRHNFVLGKYHRHRHHPKTDYRRAMKECLPAQQVQM